MYSSNSGKNTALFLTFLFPFAGLVYTLSHWRESWAKNSFWLACIYLGAVFIFWPEGTILGIGADGGRYVLKLMEMYTSGASFRGVLATYMLDTDTMDLYFPLVGYLVSRFTDNGHVLFMVFAMVFGFFYSRNIWFVLEKLPNKKLGALFILVTLFFLINPISHINGARYNTAIHIYVYALMPYLYEKDKSKLWWLFVVPLVHFSFLYVVIMALVYILLTLRRKTVGGFYINIALLLFVVSLFVNSLNLSSVGEVLEEYSPETYEERIDLYVNQDVAEGVAEKAAMTNWYVGASGIIKNWCYSLLLILLYPCLRRNFKNGQYNNLYTFALLFGAFANIMALIPSGGRFQMVSQMFMLSLFLLIILIIPRNDSFKKAMNIALMLLIIPFVVDIRRLFDFFGISALLGNFFTAFFWDNNVPLIRFLK